MSQELHWVPKSRLIPLSRKPYRVWTVIGDKPELPMTPVHLKNAFMEDFLHDWQMVGGNLKYYSRVALDSVWILCEFKDV